MTPDEKMQQSKLEELINRQVEKHRGVVNLLKIISEPEKQIIDNVFSNTPKYRAIYCENLYEMEKCLKKMLDRENQNAQQQQNVARQPYQAPG